MSLPIVGRLDRKIPEDCNTDKKKAYEYLESFQMLTYYNNFVFEQE